VYLFKSGDLLIDCRFCDLGIVISTSASLTSSNDETLAWVMWNGELPIDYTSEELTLIAQYSTMIVQSISGEKHIFM